MWIPSSGNLALDVDGVVWDCRRTALWCRQITTHTYDELGHHRLTTWHGGATTTFIYDAGDRQTQITDSADRTVTCANHNRLDISAMKAARLGAGISTLTYTYDAARSKGAFLPPLPRTRPTSTEFQQRPNTNFFSNLISSSGQLASRLRIT